MSDPSGTARAAARKIPPSTRLVTGPATATSAALPGPGAALPKDVCPPHSVSTKAVGCWPRARPTKPCASSWQNTDPKSSTTKTRATTYAPVPRPVAAWTEGVNAPVRTTAASRKLGESTTGAPAIRPITHPRGVWLGAGRCALTGPA